MQLSADGKHVLIASGPALRIIDSLQARIQVGVREYARARLRVDVGRVWNAVRRDLLSRALYGLQKVVSRQIRLQGSAASSGEYPQAIELVSSGQIQVAPLISAVAPLEEGPRWFERLYAHEPGLMKIVLAPGATT